MFTFKILSTIQTEDHSDKIDVGDTLYAGDEDERFQTEAEAISAGEHVLTGLSGHRAFDLARDSAEVVAVTV